MRRVLWIITAGAALSLGTVGCATVPKPSIELSEVVDRQIAEMHKSHEAFVSLYYAKLREDVNRFIDERWTPRFLQTTLAGKTQTSQDLLRELDASYKLIDLDPSAVTVTIDGAQVRDPAARAAIEAGIERAIQDQRAQFGQTMLKYSRGAQRQINRQRKEMLDPIDAQEQLVLASLRDGYADLTRASATIKGYLSSMVKVTEERDTILDKMGLLEKQRSLVDFAVDANDKALNLLEKGEDAQEAVKEFRERMDQVKEKVGEIKGKYEAVKNRLKD